MSKFKAIPFTNDIGQVINVNDEVVVITTSSGYVSVKRGKFVGVGGNRVVIEAEATRINWIAYPSKYERVSYMRKSYLNDNRVYHLDTPFVKMVGKNF